MKKLCAQLPTLFKTILGIHNASCQLSLLWPGRGRLPDVWAPTCTSGGKPCSMKTLRFVCFWSVIFWCFSLWGSSLLVNNELQKKTSMDEIIFKNKLWGRGVGFGLESRIKWRVGRNAGTQGPWHRFLVWSYSFGAGMQTLAPTTTDICLWPRAVRNTAKLRFWPRGTGTRRRRESFPVGHTASTSRHIVSWYRGGDWGNPIIPLLGFVGIWWDLFWKLTVFPNAGVSLILHSFILHSVILFAKNSPLQGASYPKTKKQKQRVAQLG